MIAKMHLKDLISWLKKQDSELIVLDGFGSPHSDRGYYAELAFDPLPKAKIKDMLKHAESAVGSYYTGWKGGEYLMHEHTPVYIGKYGECGEEITSIHFKYWLLTGRKEAAHDPTAPIPGTK